MRSSRIHEIDIESNNSSSSSSSINNGSASSSAGASSSRQSDLPSKSPLLKGPRGKKPGRKNRQCSAGFYLVVLLFVVGFTFLGSDYIGSLVVPGRDDGSRDWFSDPFSETHSFREGKRKRRSDMELQFGQNIRGREGGRDSRGWEDSDDRERMSFQEEYARFQTELNNNQLQKGDEPPGESDGDDRSSSSTVPGLSYERGRKELTKYERKYEDDLRKESNGTEAEADQEEDAYEEYDAEPEVVRQGSRAGKSMPVTEAVEKPDQKARGRRSRRRAACEINFANSSRVREPPSSSKFAQFDLEYVKREEQPPGDDTWTPRFAGHQSLDDRERSFLATNQTLQCGFVQGPESTGFDLSEKDREFMSSCQVAVSSCIFGKSDQLHAPRRRKMSNSSKKEVCFVMFVDQATLDVMEQEGHVPDENGFISLWRVVLVKNLPYSDFRRVGKIPKFLSHRLFPSARYSIWLDSKLRLQSDPLSILEYFLWRGNHEYAISNHYDRHCVWDEVQQNKRLNKFNHSLIDEQFMFYQRDGLTRLNASDTKRLLPSNVPEGSFIVRAHTPMSNLFSCLWFNEIDRFTPRDQLSFAYTYMKLVRMNPGNRFRFAMFKDCERKSIAKLYRHRQVTVQ